MSSGGSRRIKVKRPFLNNSIFKLQTLHSSIPSVKEIKHSERGFLSGLSVTAAHLPSYYYWMMYRGGISFTETKSLCENKRILLKGKPIETDSILFNQRPWLEFAKEDLKIVTERGDVVDPTQRAKHRQYFFYHQWRKMSFHAEEENPLSFIHALPEPDQAALSSYDVLKPAGVLDNMRGLMVATNDVMLKSLWGNEYLGGSGAYDIRFLAETPHTVIHRVKAKIAEALGDTAYIYPKDIKFINRVEISETSNVTDSHQYDRRPLSHLRLIVDTPRFPHSVWRDIARYIASCTLVRNGPFSIPLSTLGKVGRSLMEDELLQLFTFERKLKTNKLIIGLRELYDESKEPSGIEEKILFDSINGISPKPERESFHRDIHRSIIQDDD